MHGEAGLGIAAVRHLHEVLGVRPDPVLGTEQGREPERARSAQGERGVDEVARDGGGIGHEPEAQAAQTAGTRDELLEAGADSRRPVRRLAPGHYSTYLREKLPLDAALAPAPRCTVPLMLSVATLPLKRPGEPAMSARKRSVPLS